MSEQLALLPELAAAHLHLTLLALLFGVFLSVPLGILATRVRALEGPVTLVAGIVQTIPGLALLALMVPALAALGLSSIGFLPALLGLVIYSLLPILRNTITGLRGVDPAMVEAALGVGMRPSQQLWRVELPLALPVIVAGIRTATVWTVGMATLSTPVGAPSLGNYIFSGLQTRNFAAVLVGCVAASLLALTLDGIVSLLERGVRDRRRKLLAIALIAGAGLYGHSAWVLAASWGGGGQRPVRIGTKSFTEQYILGEILAARVAATTGESVVMLPSLGSTVAFDALRNDDIDLYVDYSGTIWATIMQRANLPTNRQDLLREVRRYLEDEHGIALLAALGFENTYVLAVRADDVRLRGMRAISDLKKVAPELGVGGDYEFFGRPEWHSILEVYGLRFREQRAMDPALMYQAAVHGNVDVIGAYSTDGRVAAFGLKPLDDDRGAIPPYDAVVLAASGFVARHPRAAEDLRGLDGIIDAATMRAMNLAVDRGKESPAKVARDFLERTP